VYHFNQVFPEASEPLPAVAPSPPVPVSRGRAAAEIFLCSGYPTQLLIASLLASAGLQPMVGGSLSPTFVFASLALDSIVLLSLILVFLRQSGDDPRAIFLGPREPGPEVRLGLLSVPFVLALVVAVQLVVTAVAPSLHNVDESPFAALLSSRWMLAGFIVLLIVAGGIREEFQRAFLLHRFEHRLGGPLVGLAVTSLAFGLGHTMQGWDAAVATGTLGAFWGVLYLSRRSLVAPVVSHAFFNVIQVVAGYAAITRT
jgi:membrane protease YdiL (CAAX protease family)